MPGLRFNHDERATRKGGDTAEAADPLHAHLVESMHWAHGRFAASLVLGLLTSLAGYALVGAPSFLVLAGSHSPICAARVHRIALWEQMRRKGLTARDVALSDLASLVLSTLFACILGATCYELCAHREAPDAFTLAIALCSGFLIAFGTRSAGRPVTLVAQIAGLAGPQIFAILTLQIPHSYVWAVLISGTAVASLIIGAHTRSRHIELFRANAETRRLIEYDNLTGLMNLPALVGAFARALDPLRQGKAVQIVVLAFDLDRFSHINDAFGRAVGDATLVEAAARLHDGAREAHSADIARMDGDGFLVIARVSDAKAFAQAMLERICEPFLYQGAPIPLAVSIGGAVHPDQGLSAEDLTKHAERALQEAKRAGRGRLRMFDAELAACIASEKDIGQSLELALLRDELEVWFQPITLLGSGEVSGYEALVRWRHPRLGLIMPDRFIAIAEQNGAIHELGEIVLMKACRKAVQLEPSLTLAVNLSPIQFRHPDKLVAIVRRALEISGLAPERLYLEITENFVMDDKPDTRRAVQQIADSGVRFSLDDFGRGFSSLAYVQLYPLSKIKIDREFVRNIPADSVSCAIVESVCLLARRINMSVVAEGVETQEQACALSELGVEFGQGYLFGRPERETPVRHQALEFAELRRSG